jgi:hypothetical protein
MPVKGNDYSVISFHHHQPAINFQLRLQTSLPTLISESSGLTFTDGNLWTHNDKGGLAAIYNIDTLTGNIKQTVFIDNYLNIDWEEITSDKEHIYIGDFGNNYGIRNDLKILTIDKKNITDAAIVHVQANVIRFSYSDQQKFIKNNKNNFDCEAMISVKDQLYLFSKNRGDNKTKVYRLSKTPGTYSVMPYTQFNVNGRICGASYNESTNQLALVGYMPSTVHSFLWIMNHFSGDDFFSGTKERIEIGKGKKNWKTEGIAYQSNNTLFISCENTETEKAGLYLFTEDN